MKILERDIIKIKIKDLKLDPSNPNKMTQQELAGLKESMTRFGYLTPVIVDQNNVIADGEHRVEIYKSMGLTEIPAYVVEFNDDTERKMLRQTFNKLRGEHDKVMDADELFEIMQADRLDELSVLVAKDSQELKDLVSLFHGEEEPIETDIDKTFDNNLRLTFQMPNQDTYILVTSCLAELDANNKDDALVKLVKEYNGN